MGAAYAAADMVLCRAGAGTVAEISRLGRCALFVPLPSAAGGHQEANARAMAEAGAAVLVLEKDIPDGLLQKTVTDLLSDMDRVRFIGQKAKTFGRPSAAATIADNILAVAGMVREERDAS
jgi:UDP-N-acetylglucosamine--N-acetylmuramyl-(pentapeptide) pyrophosphoryl-undecaprenol N-acetylglucosamine transferase